MAKQLLQQLGQLGLQLVVGTTKGMVTSHVLGVYQQMGLTLPNTAKAIGIVITATISHMRLNIVPDFHLVDRIDRVVMQVIAEWRIHLGPIQIILLNCKYLWPYGRDLLT